MRRIHFSLIDSTHSWVRTHLHEMPEEEMALITADEQTAGEGQFRRKWISPPGVNILATFHALLPLGQRELETVAQLLALSAARPLIEMGYPIQIKWPNDLMLTRRKVAGSRVETVMGERFTRIIASIGLNVNMGEEEAAAIDQPATSLLLFSGHEEKIPPIIDRIAHQFESDLALFRAEGFSPFRPFLEELLLIGNNH